MGRIIGNYRNDWTTKQRKLSRRDTDAVRRTVDREERFLRLNEHRD